MAGSTPVDDTATPRVLAGLRVCLHVAFAGLLGVGLLRALGGQADPGGAGGQDNSGASALTALTSPSAVAAMCLSAALAVVYLIGTVVERRRWAAGRSVGSAAAVGWLALVLALWGLLVAHHADFAWVAFPLFFVALHVVALTVDTPLVRRLIGPLIVAVMAGVVVLGAAVGPGTGEGAGDPVLRPAAVIGPLVGAAVAVVLYGAYRALHLESVRQRAVAERLRAAQHELARTERLAGVATERERLAREIHDTLTQGLASIVLVSRAARDALDADDAALARARLEIVRETAAENLAESRAFVRGLHASSAADGAGFVSALERAVEAFARRQDAAGTPVQAEVEVVGTPMAVPASTEQAVLRATQSSLANVAAHARATRTRVTVSFLPGQLAVDVADDGVGFDPDDADEPTALVPKAPQSPQRGTGLGLRAVRARMRAVGGHAEVETAPGEGTVVVLRAPLTDKAEEARR